MVLNENPYDNSERGVRDNMLAHNKLIKILNKDKSFETLHQLVIDKWQEITDRCERAKWFGQIAKIRYYSDTCAFCLIYGEIDCNGCPIDKSTGGWGCSKTPWENFDHAILSRNLKAARKYAREELEFIKGLTE